MYIYSWWKRRKRGFVRGPLAGSSCLYIFFLEKNKFLDNVPSFGASPAWRKIFFNTFLGHFSFVPYGVGYRIAIPFNIRGRNRRRATFQAIPSMDNILLAVGKNVVQYISNGYFSPICFLLIKAGDFQSLSSEIIERSNNYSASVERFGRTFPRLIIRELCIHTRR